MLRWLAIAALLSLIIRDCTARLIAAETALVQSSQSIEFDSQGRPSDAAPVITAVAVLRGGEIVATGGDDHVVRLWSTTTGRIVRVLKGHDDWIRSLSFSPDCQHLVSAADDRQILIWQVETGKLVKRLRPHEHAVYAVTYSPDGAQIAVAGFADHVCLYDANSGAFQHEHAGPGTDLRALAYSPDGTNLAAAGRGGQIRVWSLATRKALLDIAAGPGRVRTLAYLPDGDKLVSAGDGRTIALWDAKTGGEIYKFNCPKGKVLSMAVCGESLIATGGSDNVVRVWNWQTRSEVDRLLGHTGSVATLAYDPASGMMISGSFDTTVRVWRLAAPADDKATAGGPDATAR